MKFLILLTILFLTACSDDDVIDKTNKNIAKTSSVNLGEQVFNQNCIVCHGKKAAGLAKDWRKADANGNLPAPPLNGRAHAWHHSPQILLATINNGGAKLGGIMPGFKDKLSEVEKQSILQYLYSLWPQDIQQKYDARFK